MGFGPLRTAPKYQNEAVVHRLITSGRVGTTATSEVGILHMYISTDLAFNQRNDISDDQLEMLWIELLPPHTRPILISTFYRPQTTKKSMIYLKMCVDKKILELECFFTRGFKL